MEISLLLSDRQDKHNKNDNNTKATRYSIQSQSKSQHNSSQTLKEQNSTSYGKAKKKNPKH